MYSIHWRLSTLTWGSREIVRRRLLLMCALCLQKTIFCKNNSTQQQQLKKSCVGSGRFIGCLSPQLRKRQLLCCKCAHHSQREAPPPNVHNIALHLSSVATKYDYKNTHTLFLITIKHYLIWWSPPLCSLILLTECS